MVLLVFLIGVERGLRYNNDNINVRIIDIWYLLRVVIVLRFLDTVVGVIFVIIVEGRRYCFFYYEVKVLGFRKGK